MTSGPVALFPEQKMLDDGVVAHASGDAMRTFVYGFYFYRIVGEKDGTRLRLCVMWQPGSWTHNETRTLRGNGMGSNFT